MLIYISIFQYLFTLPQKNFEQIFVIFLPDNGWLKYWSQTLKVLSLENLLKNLHFTLSANHFVTAFLRKYLMILSKLWVTHVKRISINYNLCSMALSWHMTYWHNGSSKKWHHTFKFYGHLDLLLSNF